MARKPREFDLELTEDEANELRVPAGEGGHQQLHEELLLQLEDGNTLKFDDEELGRLLRYMTQYKSGGFQGRLRRAFERSLKAALGF